MSMGKRKLWEMKRLFEKTHQEYGCFSDERISLLADILEGDTPPTMGSIVGDNSTDLISHNWLEPITHMLKNDTYYNYVISILHKYPQLHISEKEIENFFIDAHEYITSILGVQIFATLKDATEFNKSIEDHDNTYREIGSKGSLLVTDQLGEKQILLHKGSVDGDWFYEERATPYFSPHTLRFDRVSSLQKTNNFEYTYKGIKNTLPSQEHIEYYATGTLCLLSPGEDLLETLPFAILETLKNIAVSRFDKTTPLLPILYEELSIQYELDVDAIALFWIAYHLRIFDILGFDSTQDIVDAVLEIQRSLDLYEKRICDMIRSVIDNYIQYDILATDMHNFLGAMIENGYRDQVDEQGFGELIIGGKKFWFGEDYYDWDQDVYFDDESEDSGYSEEDYNEFILSTNSEETDWTHGSPDYIHHILEQLHTFTIPLYEKIINEMKIPIHVDSEEHKINIRPLTYNPITQLHSVTQRSGTSPTSDQQ